MEVDVVGVGLKGSVDGFGLEAAVVEVVLNG